MSKTSPDGRVARVFSGLSGADVLLMTKDDRHWFVRKRAASPNDNNRLQRQMAKMVALAEATDVVRTPRVFKTGEHEGRFFFDMEFIRGANGIGFLRRANYEDVNAFADRFCRYLAVVASLPPDHVNTLSLFESLFGKLCEVQERTAALDDATLATLFLALERVRKQTSHLTETRCHGDLTLENIVIDSRGEIWMLDLLAAPFEHYWQDLAKLHQDLAGGWYLRHNEPIARCVVDFISRRLLSVATKLDPAYAEAHWLMVATTFVRILPYVRTIDEAEFVKQRIQHFSRRSLGARV